MAGIGHPEGEATIQDEEEYGNWGNGHVGEFGKARPKEHIRGIDGRSWKREELSWQMKE